MKTYPHLSVASEMFSDLVRLKYSVQINAEFNSYMILSNVHVCLFQGK